MTSSGSRSGVGEAVLGGAGETCFQLKVSSFKSGKGSMQEKLSVIDFVDKDVNKLEAIKALSLEESPFKFV
ncbi:hypothetical protein ISN45_Aa02g019510 [Arabidopsis thaliana x Arabidopsis arenosa]|uniref:Uncharacterized protein n=1 Tax=Arabidopsis thaliana x Arabidopsis arenosa TaxID=1240361 RepID=A0A8T2BNQ8_9BRAS|nr:hypothetical protein ISN45_Aa02g019510 [Arabidopsis thaliana x Arabidopsis arenosa]